MYDCVLVPPKVTVCSKDWKIALWCRDPSEGIICCFFFEGICVTLNTLFCTSVFNFIFFGLYLAFGPHWPFFVILYWDNIVTLTSESHGGDGSSVLGAWHRVRGCLSSLLCVGVCFPAQFVKFLGSENSWILPWTYCNSGLSSEDAQHVSM